MKGLKEAMQQRKVASDQIETFICKKHPYSECFWSVFSRIRNAGKYGPEKLRIQTLFAQRLVALVAQYYQISETVAQEVFCRKTVAKLTENLY